MSNHIKAEIVRLMREEFDPCPPNYRGYSWHDCAEEVADSIVALFASPQTDLVSRAEVLRVIRSLGDQDADLAMYGAADNARAREYGEAAATRACCAIALMPPASPSPAPAAVEDLAQRLRDTAHGIEAGNVADPHGRKVGLLREAATALSTLAADKARIEAERDEEKASKDGAYAERNRCVSVMAKLALAAGYPVGIAQTAIEGWDEAWHGCVYMDLPTGQASWHYHADDAALFNFLPPYAGTWDGHTTPEKYARIEQFWPMRPSPAEARASALEGEVERLWEAAMGSMAALAAAISLLERTPAAKKAAPSDTMFVQMLADYRKALDTARAALSPAKETTDE